MSLWTPSNSLFWSKPNFYCDIALSAPSKQHFFVPTQLPLQHFPFEFIQQLGLCPNPISILRIAPFDLHPTSFLSPNPISIVIMLPFNSIQKVSERLVVGPAVFKTTITNNMPDPIAYMLKMSIKCSNCIGTEFLSKF